MRSIFFDLSLYLSLAAAIAYLLAGMTGWKKGWVRAACGAMAASAILGVAFVVQEWIVLERPPFVGTFEVMVFLGVSLMLVHLAFERVYRTSVAGPFAALLALMVMAYATLFSGGAQPVMPALRNNFWLTIHVMLCFVGYAAFFLSFVAGVLHLAASGAGHRAGAACVAALTAGGVAAAAGAMLAARHGLFAQAGPVGVWTGVGAALLFSLAFLWPAHALMARLAPSQEGGAAVLDSLVYRSITLGFPFLGLGIITGAVWANEAWGRYWGWDPKETWSLITWLVYFLYLHLRFMRGWRGPRSSWFAVGGFYAVIFTFFGVSYLLPGLHSYLAG